MKMRILIISLLFVTNSCSQETKNQPAMKNEINSQNFVTKILESINHYDSEPEYLLRINNGGYYEILVNDLPVIKHYRISTIGSPIDINFAILKSGKQKISYRFYPVEDNEKKFTNSFLENTRYKITILVRDKQEVERVGLLNAEEKKVIIKELKTTADNGEIPVGSTYYEGSFEFDAEVPYENEGWSKGQDLTKFDQEELEKAVLAFYQKMWNIYDDKTKIDEQFPLILNREIETAQSQYFGKEEVNEALDFYLMPYKLNYFELQPIENYKIVNYGEGRIVSLEQQSSDVRLRGQFALWAKIKLNGEKSIRTYFPNLYLYLPEGKSLEDGLAIIR